MNRESGKTGGKARVWVKCLLGLLLLTGIGASPQAKNAERITLTMRDAAFAEVMEMLSRTNRVSILLAEGVSGQVSFNLFEVSLDEAVRSISSAARFVVERQGNTYFIMPAEQAGKAPGRNFTVVKSMSVQYADVAELETKLEGYLSDYGTVTALPDRKLLVIKDQPDYVARISKLLADLDRRPPQVLIEAKILEVKLNDEQSYGIDWTGIFTNGDGDGDFGVQGLLSPGNSGNTGFFFNYLEPRLDVALRLLQSDGRVRNLASPKVVTIADHEAEVIIGDRRGYRVTTTINQVTTESIEFLESGVILRVTPTIDENNEVLLNIHPEVSTGTVDENGIPSQTTTEVTTRLLVPSGQSIFIGGLMRNTTNETLSGVPVLGRIPGLRWLFSNRSRTSFNTETVVIITPHILDEEFAATTGQTLATYDEVNQAVSDRAKAVDEQIETTFRKPAPPDKDVNSQGNPAASPGELPQG